LSGADTKLLVEQAVADFQKLVPALANLKLVTELELRGRGDVQLYRVELIGRGDVRITKDIASDAKVRISIPRSHFNELVDAPTLRHWREAFESGHAKASGPPQTLQLIAQVITKQEEKDRARKPRAHNRAR
jgi:hypothetical protein